MFINKKTEKTEIDSTINQMYLKYKSFLDKDFSRVDSSERTSGKYGNYKQNKGFEIMLLQYGLLNQSSDEITDIKKQLACMGLSWDTSTFSYTPNNYINYFPDNAKPLIEI